MAQNQATLRQPDFTKISQSAPQITDAISELQYIPNMPAVDQGNRILDALQQIQRNITQIQRDITVFRGEFNTFKQTTTTSIATLRTEMRSGFQAVNLRMDVMETNSRARSANVIVNKLDSTLAPLVDTLNGAIANFPANLEALYAMNGPVLGTLLTQCGLPVNGTVAAKQSRFKQWIGVATAV